MIISNKTYASSIGAGSRGAAAPLEIFWPPLGDFCPPETCILSHFWDKNQKNAPNPAKTFFLENASFRDKKNAPVPAMTFISRSRLWRSRSCPPCPKIVPAPLGVRFRLFGFLSVNLDYKQYTNYIRDLIVLACFFFKLGLD